jgi:CheY-like chemotaxis protein
MAKVLVVDAEPGGTEAIRGRLARDGHEVETAWDRRTALAGVARTRPDVVLLDVAMQGHEGWRLLEALAGHRDAWVRSTPVVVLTVRDSDLDRARSGIEGAVAHLTKGSPAGAVAAAVEAALAAPDGQQLRARRAALAALAEVERRAAGGAEPVGPHPRLRDLEHLRGPAIATRPAERRERVEVELTARQRRMLAALSAAPSVSAAAASLGVSRSNVYAGLRRVGRRAGVDDVGELLALVRSGRLAADP